jgi:hypothetical protein
MSPEQVRGLPLDHRSDVFTVGILLYEMLTGERLFGGESDFGTLEKVRNAIVTPPTTYNAKIPKQLEKTVLRALAKDPEERHEWASDLQEDLVRFLMHDGSLITGKSLASFVRDLFAKDIAKENERLAVFRRRGYPWVDEALSKKESRLKEEPRDEGYPDDETMEHQGAQPTVILSDEGAAQLSDKPWEGEVPSLAEGDNLAGQATMILPEALEEEPTPVPKGKKRPARKPARKRSGTDVRRRGRRDTEPVRGRAPLAKRRRDPKEAARKKRLIGTVAAFCLGLFVAVIAAYFIFAPSEGAPDEETAARSEMAPISPPEEPAKPAPAPAEKPEKPSPAEKPKTEEPKAEEPKAEEPKAEEKPPPKVAAAKVAEEKKPPPPAPAPKPVERTFPAAKDTPPAPPKPPPKTKKRKRKKKSKVASRDTKGGPSILVKSTPPGAEILLNGKKIGKTPTTIGGLKPRKNYFMVLKKDGYKPFFQGVKFKGRKRVVVNATLQPGKFAASKTGGSPKASGGGKGYLIANTKPWARVIIDGKDTGQWTPIVGKRKLSLSAGSHKITFKTKDGKTLTVNVNIKAGQTTKVIKQIP